MPDDQMKWRLPDCWTVTHLDGQKVTIEVTQDANTLVGTASGGPSDPSAGMTGTMSGSVDGDILTMTIYWPDNSISEYHGTVTGDGTVSGTISDRRDSASTEEWFGKEAFAAWGQ